MERWGFVFLGIVAAGILSRLGRTGFVLVDKYLGDALYAAMVYAMLRWRWGRWGSLGRSEAAVGASLAMIAVECLQLTGWAEEMLRQGGLTARRLGVENRGAAARDAL
jgi:Na+-driven multidrug efflux pump